MRIKVGGKEGHRTQLCTLLLFFAKIKGIMNAYIVY